MPIKILPEQVASQIAAGEVVERPASVVKELVENAIDAGAGQIKVKIIQAGKELIEVSDDGFGIPSSEVQTAIKRYTTSKISTISDLEKISTLGFRGEALASIASVSRLQIDTKTKNEKAGISLIFEGGREISSTNVGIPAGTQISVRNLFFNVPARKKFLKSDISEKRQISELVENYALIYPHIRFVLAMEQKIVLKTNGTGDRREILSQIYGLDIAKQMLDLEYKKEKMNIAGFISPLGVTRSNRKDIRFAVIGRSVSNSTLMSAVLRAYHGYLMVGRFPIVALFINLPPEELDVNVHPAKSEIKFDDERGMFSDVHSAVRKTISAYFPVPDLPANLWQTIKANQDNIVIDPSSQGEIFPASLESSNEHNLQDFGSESSHSESLHSILRLIGQLGATYIAAEGPDGLYLIDQHSAHERILFERIKQNRADKATSQLLLEPNVIQLNSFEFEELRNREKVLRSLGFQFAYFGTKTIKLTAVPALISHMDPEDAFKCSIELDDDEKEFIEQIAEDKIIMQICKKAAIKGGQILSRQEQEQLLHDLESCESPRTCPHGRPTMIHLSVDLLARQFGRRGSI